MDVFSKDYIKISDRIEKKKARLGDDFGLKMNNMSTKKAGNK